MSDKKQQHPNAPDRREAALSDRGDFNKGAQVLEPVRFPDGYEPPTTSLAQPVAEDTGAAAGDDD